MGRYDCMYLLSQEEYDLHLRKNQNENAGNRISDSIQGDIHGSQVTNIEVSNGGTIIIPSKKGLPTQISQDKRNQARLISGKNEDEAPEGSFSKSKKNKNEKSRSKIKNKISYESRRNGEEEDEPIHNFRFSSTSNPVDNIDTEKFLERTLEGDVEMRDLSQVSNENSLNSEKFKKRKTGDPPFTLDGKKI